MTLMYDFETLVGQDSPLSFFISPELAQITVCICRHDMIENT